MIILSGSQVTNWDKLGSQIGIYLRYRQNLVSFFCLFAIFAYLCNTNKT